jgi:hypothetical protein
MYLFGGCNSDLVRGGRAITLAYVEPQVVRPLYKSSSSSFVSSTTISLVFMANMR